MKLNGQLNGWNLFITYADLAAHLESRASIAGLFQHTRPLPASIDCTLLIPELDSATAALLVC